MPGKTGCGENGFTFAELMVAVTILAVVTVPLLSLLASGHAAAVFSGRQTTAVNLCRAGVEEIKARGYDYYMAVIEENAGAPYTPPAEDPVPGFSFFSRRAVVAAEILPGLNGLEVKLLRVTVTVSWMHGDGERSVALETYLAERN